MSAIQVEGRVGPDALSDGATAVFRMGRSAEAVVQNLHGRYFEQTYRGNIFCAANPAAQAVSVALATTYTGLLLYNPLNSGVVLVPNKVKFALSVAPAAIATIGLICGLQTIDPTGLTALTVRNTRIGNGGQGQGRVYSAATILTPVWLQQLWDGFTAAALPAPQNLVDLEGLYQILPGGFIAIGALTAVTGLGSIAWEEVSL